jgi:hypothetical protein
MFIAYMDCLGFFKSNNISYDKWVRSKNYNIGGRQTFKEDLYTLKEIAEYNNGMNLVREKLMNLEWHKR